jgi:nucleoside 2-deoxyribosyltransferase
MIPDSGTVWEMGYAYGHHIPIIGYYMSTPPKMNLMLAFACKGIVKDIFKFILPNGEFNWTKIQKWEGALL